MVDMWHGGEKQDVAENVETDGGKKKQPDGNKVDNGVAAVQQMLEGRSVVFAAIMQIAMAPIRNAEVRCVVRAAETDLIDGI
jgi:hypothetical protein